MASRKNYYVGVDLGGTSLRAMVVDEKYRLLASEKVRTPVGQKPRVTIAKMAEVIKAALGSAAIRSGNVAAVSVGAPGTINARHGVVEQAPNLGWTNVPLASELRQRLGVPVRVDNDVNVGMMGEYALGAGRGAKDLVGIFVGTGIGGALIINGKLFEGACGGAGEIGHTVILVNGPLCHCGHRGCAEALASRTAMERDVRAAIQSGQKSLVPKIMRKKGHTRMTSSVIQSALNKHDRVMEEVFKRAQYYLGILVANAVNLLDPERVVIGGGIAARLRDEFVAAIRETAYEYFIHAGRARAVKILPGKLDDDAGPLGAVVLARRGAGVEQGTLKK
jgi:glucokinase